MAAMSAPAMRRRVRATGPAPAAPSAEAVSKKFAVPPMYEAARHDAATGHTSLLAEGNSAPTSEEPASVPNTLPAHPKENAASMGSSPETAGSGALERGTAFLTSTCRPSGWAWALVWFELLVLQTPSISAAWRSTDQLRCSKKGFSSQVGTSDATVLPIAKLARPESTLPPLLHANAATAFTTTESRSRGTCCLNNRGSFTTDLRSILATGGRLAQHTSALPYFAGSTLAARSLSCRLLSQRPAPMVLLTGD